MHTKFDIYVFILSGCKLLTNIKEAKNIRQISNVGLCFTICLNGTVFFFSKLSKINEP